MTARLHRTGRLWHGYAFPRCCCDDVFWWGDAVLSRPDQLLGIGHAAALLPALLGRPAPARVVLARIRRRAILRPLRQRGQRQRHKRRAHTDKEAQACQPASQGVNVYSLPVTHDINPAFAEDSMQAGSLSTSGTLPEFRSPSQPACAPWAKISRHREPTYGTSTSEAVQPSFGAENRLARGWSLAIPCAGRPRSNARSFRVLPRTRPSSSTRYGSATRPRERGRSTPHPVAASPDPIQVVTSLRPHL